MEIISSKNDKIKNLIKLKQKKYRDETNLVLIEGYKIFEEALKANVTVKEIFLTESFLQKKNINFQNQTLISNEVSNKLTYNITSQNFFAVLEKPKKEISTGNFLILDQIQDPQNLGAIIRTAVACDIKNLYLLNTVDIFNDKVIRASMGNVFKVSYMNVTIKDLEEICKDKTIYCADMGGENIFEHKEKCDNFGLILGNEGNGVSEDVKKLSSKIISIPMKNNVESLNVAVSMAIISYQLTEKFNL